MYQGSKSSHYLTFIPPNNQEVIKLRISDHPSNEHEWEEKEMTGLPNRRYSIVIFSNKSMPNESVQNIKELKWESYISQNIPVHEKSFNRYYLNETYEILKKILLSIFNGGSPEDKSITIKINENKINTGSTGIYYCLIIIFAPNNSDTKYQHQSFYTVMVRGPWYKHL